MRLLDVGPQAVDQFWEAHARSELIGLRTSGTTTGRSRVVQRTTRSWVDSFDAVAAWVGLGPSDRLWIPGPMSATMNLFAACLAGYVGAMWTPDPAHATAAQLTPARVNQLVVDRCQDGTTSPLTVIVAGDGLSRSLRDRASSVGLKIRHYYGAAELSIVATGTCGDDLELFDSVEAEVVDAQLWVRSPWLSVGYASGYLDAPLRINNAGFYTVGDRANLDGRKLTVQGRDGFITTAGETVELSPLKAMLQEQCSHEVYLVGLPDPSLGQILTCIVSDSTAIDPLRTWARANLSGASRPRLWTTCEDLPTTPTGKIDHRALANHAAHRLGRAA